MKKILHLTFLCSLFLVNYFCAGLTPKPDIRSVGPKIRVLLLEEKSAQLMFPGNYRIYSEDRSDIILPKNKPVVFKTGRAKNSIDVLVDSDYFFSTQNGFSVKAVGSNQEFKLSGKNFHGDLRFELNDNQIQVINVIKLELYLKGVVPAEIGNLRNSEMAAIKAQAIASRTYALKKLEVGNNRPYDILSDVRDQVYSGNSKRFELTDLAVDKTVGEVAVYNDTLIYAFYHSTCGGRTEYGKNQFSGGNKSYLQGVSDNFSSGDFCKASPLYRWDKSFLFEDITKSIRKNLTDFVSAGTDYGSVTDIVVTQRLKSGRVEEIGVLFDNKKTPLVLKGRNLGRVFRGNQGNLLPSNFFKISKKNSNSSGFTIIGAGNGHGVGMCQWGAIGMAAQGYNYKQILKHYYRGITIKKIY